MNHFCVSVQVTFYRTSFFLSFVMNYQDDNLSTECVISFLGLIIHICEMLYDETPYFSIFYGQCDNDGSFNQYRYRHGFVILQKLSNVAVNMIGKPRLPQHTKNSLAECPCRWEVSTPCLQTCFTVQNCCCALYKMYNILFAKIDVFDFVVQNIFHCFILCITKLFYSLYQDRNCYKTDESD